MIKEGDQVRIKMSAPKCCAHRGEIGTVEKIKYARGAIPVYFVRFADRRCELHKEKNLEKINA